MRPNWPIRKTIMNGTISGDYDIYLYQQTNTNT